MSRLNSLLIFIIVASVTVPVLFTFLLAGFSLLSGQRIFSDDFSVPVVIACGIFLLVVVKHLIRANRDVGISGSDLRDVEARLARLEAHLELAPTPVKKKRRGAGPNDDSALVQTLHEHSTKMQERLENLETVLIEKARH